MFEPKRARRRRDMQRMKARAAYYLRRIRNTEEKWITPRHIGILAATHCKPCSCSLGCGNRRAEHGPPISERRAT